FAVVDVRGEQRWVGKCLHCGSRLMVMLDGTLLGTATIEHIVPRHHGGSDETQNLGLACASCNHEKGRRHDARRKPSARASAASAGRRARRGAGWGEMEP